MTEDTTPMPDPDDDTIALMDHPHSIATSYEEAFFAIAELLGINAEPKSPMEVFQEKMLPRLRLLIDARIGTKPDQLFSTALPDAAVHAGEVAWDEARKDLINYTPGETIDWDEGMIITTIYLAVQKSIRNGAVDRDL